MVPPTTDPTPDWDPRWSPDGNQIAFWKLSLNDGGIGRLTKLEGRRGRLGYFFSSNAQYLYFIWYEDDSDIFVMDAVTGS